MSKAWEEVKQVASDTAGAVGDIAEGAVKVVGDAGNVVGATVSGGSAKDALADLAASGSKIYSGTIDFATLGQADKIDPYTGGLISATKNTGNFSSDLIAGRSVKQDLKDAARVGAVVASGGYYGVAAGVGVNSALVGADGKSQINLKRGLGAVGAVGTGNGFVDNILRGVGASDVKRPASNGVVGETGYYDNYGDSYLGDSGSSSSNKKVLLILGITGITLLVIAMKKKKK